MKGPVRRWAPAAALALAAVWAPLAGSAAQDSRPDSAATRDPAPGPPSPQTGGWGAADVGARPGNTVVTVTVAFPRGSSEDPDGSSGATWMLGRVIREVALGSLAPDGRASTEIAVEVERSRTLFRLATLPRHWERAYDALEWALFGAALPSGDTERVRTATLGVFAFEEDAPHREFEVELYRLLSAPGSPWSRPPRGDAPGISGLDVGALTLHRGRVFRKAEATVSVVGAVDPDGAARRVTGGPALDPGGVVAPGFTPLTSRDSPLPVWDEGLRVVTTREVTSTWIAVAFPVDPETSATALDVLLHRLDAEFNPSPPDPGTFDVGVRVELLGTRRLLVVEAAVLGEAADAWERRILSAVAEIADDEMELPYFAAYRRRFRAARLVEDAAPENESARRANDLLLHGRVRPLSREISGLTADDLQEAADDLGEPRILVFGPDLGDGASW